MGNICGSTTEKPPAESLTPDPVTKLSARDRKLIRELWAEVTQKKSIKIMGLQFMVKLFHKDPGIQFFFKDLQNLPAEEVTNSQNFRACSVSLMLKFSAYVECMDEPAILSTLVTAQARAEHYQGLRIKEMEVVTSCLLEFLADESEGPNKTQALVAWRKLLDFVNAKYEAERVLGLNNAESFSREKKSWTIIM